MSNAVKLTSIAFAIASLVVGNAHAQSVEPVAPGSIRIHLDGYLQFLLGTVGGNGMSGGSVSAGTYWKNNSIGTTGDVRLYPGLDGMTVNSVAYGVQVELRTASTNANGAGVNSSSASTNGVGSLYVRRAYGYHALRQDPQLLLHAPPTFALQARHNLAKYLRSPQEVPLTYRVIVHESTAQIERVQSPLSKTPQDADRLTLTV